MVAGGFWVLVATEGPGGWYVPNLGWQNLVQRNLTPVFQIELNSLVQNTRDTWALTSGCCFLWTFH